MGTVQKNKYSEFAIFLSQIKDNKVDIEGVVNVAKMAYSGDEERAKKARDLATDCSAITDADRCEAAAKIFDCGKNFVFNVDIMDFHVVEFLLSIL